MNPLNPFFASQFRYILPIQKRSSLFQGSAFPLSFLIIYMHFGKLTKYYAPDKNLSTFSHIMFPRSPMLIFYFILYLFTTYTERTFIEFSCVFSEKARLLQFSVSFCPISAGFCRFFVYFKQLDMSICYHLLTKNGKPV